MKANITEFIRENYDYLNDLKKVSEDKKTSRYLLEYIANGFIKYGETVDGFIKNIDKWMKSLSKEYKEISFNKDINQLFATIDLIDHFIIIDQELIDVLQPIIQTQKKYGLLITYKSDKRNLAENTTTLSRFFEFIEQIYPVRKDRYKGLGTSPGVVLKEVTMDPKSRRLIRVTADNINTLTRVGYLVGDGKENMKQRKELLMNFDFNVDMLDN